MNLPSESTRPPPSVQDVVLITGISGSGKSVVMHALEDAGFFCVDNLPPELLRAFIETAAARAQQQMEQRIAVAVDVRSSGSLPLLILLLNQLAQEGMVVRTLFLDASTEALVRRFSESRRPHPLSAQSQALSGAAPTGAGDQLALVEAINLERAMMAGLRSQATVIDTTKLRPAQLRQWVRDLLLVPHSQLTLVFESFAFKQGVPLDADFVFDVRVLPNPYYVRELRPQNGRDAEVAAYLHSQPEAQEMVQHITQFLQHWLGRFEQDQRSYLTIAIGCTGGQHRSVYISEQLAQHFSALRPTLVRHREIER
jgi:UPF0042 nucleotide-binding protein